MVANRAIERFRRIFGLRTALSTLVASTVAATALIIHLSWSATAEQNVADVAGQLNDQIAASVRRELKGMVASSLSLQEAVRSIIERGGIMASEADRRDVVLISLLRSTPGISWVSLGLPNGSFVGAQKLRDDAIDLVEVDRSATPIQRVAHYRVTPNDISLRSRETAPTKYDATAEDWFRRAVDAGGPIWTQLPRFPNSERDAITTATPLMVGGRLAGVVSVAIEVDRLSRFLAGVPIGRTGSAAILDPSGYVIGSPDPETIRLQEGNATPTIGDLARRDAMFRIAADYLARTGLTVSDIKQSVQMTVAAANGGRPYFVMLTPLDFQGWVLATIIPAADFLARIDRNSHLLLILLGVLTLIIIATSIYAAHLLVAKPLLRITGQLRHVEKFELERIAPLPSLLRELDDFSTAIVQMARGLASFHRYIPADLVRTLVAQGVEAKPGGVRQTLTVMFTDLAGFTGLSERLMEEVVPLLTRYLEETASAVTAHGGTIDKFIGDAVMAFWGAPMANPNHAADACAAALAAVRRIAAMDCGLSVRIGINTGTVLVGNIGSSDRLSYTAIGDPVNIASRLENLNKRYGTQVLLGEATRNAAGARIVARRLDRVAVYGRSEGTLVYELLSMAEEAVPAWARDYEAGFAAYEERRWSDAVILFEACARRRGGDRPAMLMIARCRELVSSPPGSEWQPVIVIGDK
jgi:adenylate cyclase